LFELFGRIKVKNGINENGIGLGLTISKRIIEELGGEMRLKSQLMKGTTITFTMQT
jgi:signal transduction histidine kinase